MKGHLGNDKGETYHICYVLQVWPSHIGGYLYIMIMKNTSHSRANASHTGFINEFAYMCLLGTTSCIVGNNPLTVYL